MKIDEQQKNKKGDESSDGGLDSGGDSTVNILFFKMIAFWTKKIFIKSDYLDRVEIIKKINYKGVNCKDNFKNMISSLGELNVRELNLIDLQAILNFFLWILDGLPLSSIFFDYNNFECSGERYDFKVKRETSNITINIDKYELKISLDDINNNYDLQNDTLEIKTIQEMLIKYLCINFAKRIQFGKEMYEDFCKKDKNGLGEVANCLEEIVTPSQEESNNHKQGPSC